jgi:hypothetical protein
LETVPYLKKFSDTAQKVKKNKNIAKRSGELKSKNFKRGASKGSKQKKRRQSRGRLTYLIADVVRTNAGRETSRKESLVHKLRLQ